MRVDDERTNAVPAEGATIGEIVVRGNVVMKGYYNDPDATAQAFRGGYMHTGDAAVMHPDRYVEVRDRIKDVIIRGGENISAVAVESVLVRHPSAQEGADCAQAQPTLGESTDQVVQRQTAPPATV